MKIVKGREQAHSPKRQYRRQCEREGLVKKSGRQWVKFRKMMQRMAKETIAPEKLVPNEETLKAMEEARQNLGSVEPVTE